jgi:hypothetical protein
MKNRQRRTESRGRKTADRKRRANSRGQRTACKGKKPDAPACKRQCQGKQCCRGCAYAGKLRDGRRVLLVCVNCPGRLGQLTRVPPDGVCRSFRPREKRTGRRSRASPSPDDICYIALTKNKFAMVSARDYKRLSRYSWYACLYRRKYYARRDAEGRRTYMHREIMRPPKGMVIDHIDGNGLNNWRKDLRVCTMLENGHNSKPQGHTSRFKGVSYDEILRKWEAAICLNRKMVTIGYFNTEIEAARAYDRRAWAEFGIHAWLNFPHEYPPRVRRRHRRKK